MNVIPTISNKQEIQSPPEGGFIGLPDISGKIKDIIEVNEGFPEEELIELTRLKYPNAGEGFRQDENGYFKKVFPSGGYIRLQEVSSSDISIDMIQMPGSGVQAMLEVFSFCVENGYSTIKGKIQPQKKPNPRRKKILLDKWINFGFSSGDGTNIELVLSQTNIKVLGNKVKYYLENGKWFTS